MTQQRPFFRQNKPIEKLEGQNIFPNLSGCELFFAQDITCDDGAKIININVIYNSIAEKLKSDPDFEYVDNLSPILNSRGFEILYYSFSENKVWIEIEVMGFKAELTFDAYHIFQNNHMVNYFSDEVIEYTICGDEYTSTPEYFFNNHCVLTGRDLALAFTKGSNDLYRGVESWITEVFKTIDNLIPKFETKQQ